jgi:hypothetical protein
MATGARFLGRQHDELGEGAAGSQPLGDEPQRYPAEHIEGVPARDLSAEEWSALADEQREAALSSGLYELSAPSDETARKWQKPADVPSTEGDS